jgi:hypothetical protein
MASDVIKYALMAGAGYLAWKTYTDSQAVAAVLPAPAPGTTTTPPATTTPAVITLEQRLLNAAGVPATFTQGPDQWAYHYAGLTDALGIPKGSLDPSVLDVWFPTGRPDDQSKYPQLTAAQFAAGLKSKGLSGYWRVIPVPRLRVQ